MSIEIRIVGQRRHALAVAFHRHLFSGAAMIWLLRTSGVRCTATGAGENACIPQLGAHLSRYCAGGWNSEGSMR
jgi:hypothetical protein